MERRNVIRGASKRVCCLQVNIKKEIVSMKTSDTSAKERIDEIDRNQQKLEQKAAQDKYGEKVPTNASRNR